MVQCTFESYENIEIYLGKNQSYQEQSITIGVTGSFIEFSAQSSEAVSVLKGMSGSG